MNDKIYNPKIVEISIREFFSRKEEGLVILAAGGDLFKFFNDITDDLIDEKIIEHKEDMTKNGEIYKFKYGQSINIFLIWNDKCNVGKLAMWRQRTGPTFLKWATDFRIDFKHIL